MLKALIVLVGALLVSQVSAANSVWDNLSAAPVGMTYRVSPGQMVYTEVRMDKIPMYTLSQRVKSKMKGGMGLKFWFSLEPGELPAQRLQMLRRSDRHRGTRLFSGEDTLPIDRKFLGSVSMKLATRFMFLTNELPRLNDASTALEAQLLVSLDHALADVAEQSDELVEHVGFHVSRRGRARGGEREPRKCARVAWPAPL